VSSNVRHSAKRDSNEAEIVEFLRKHGCTVDRISGTGVPDLLVGYRGIKILMEVKMTGKKLRPAQEEWHSYWRGQRTVVETVFDAALVLMDSYSERLRAGEG
jgi:hypothetical protein